jgi:hypothetical protein
MCNITMLLQCAMLRRWRFYSSCCSGPVVLLQWKAVLHCSAAMAGVAKKKIKIFFYSRTSRPSLKTSSSYLYVKERKRMRKKKGGGLKPTLLVSRNITQAPSNNTSSNISSNLLPPIATTLIATTQ